jgi:hypothetical protein
MLQPQIVGFDMDSPLDQILAAVSGDPDVVGAIATMNPSLAQSIAAAQRRRMVVGSSSEGRPLNTHLPMINGSNAVAAAGAVALTGTPLRNFKPNGLVIQTDGVAVTVDSVTVANIPQLGGSTGSVASDVYKRDAIMPYELDWQVIPQNQSLIATCTNRHAATACAIFGGVYGKYTLAS